MTARSLDFQNTTSDGSWATAGNWYDLTNSMTAASIPATGDTAYVNTSFSITTGFAQGSVQLAKLVLGPTFTGALGASGTPLVIGADALEYSGRSSGIFITAGTGGITLSTITGANQFTAAGGTWATVGVGPGGNFYAAAAATVTSLKGAGGSGYAEPGTAFTMVKWSAGSFTSARSLGAANISGPGTQFKTIMTAGSTTADVGGGSTWTINATGTNVTVDVMSGGTLSSAGAAQPPVITNLNKYAGSNVFQNQNSASVATTKPIGYASLF